jgi:hypothetical protein
MVIVANISPLCREKNFGVNLMIVVMIAVNKCMVSGIETFISSNTISNFKSHQHF